MTWLDLVDRNVIRIVDVEFVQKDGDGVRAAAVIDLPSHPGVDLSEWEGGSSGLLDIDDHATIGAEIGDGTVAVVVVFENAWVLGLVDSWSKSGARLDRRRTDAKYSQTHGRRPHGKPQPTQAAIQVLHVRGTAPALPVLLRQTPRRRREV